MDKAWHLLFLLAYAATTARGVTSGPPMRELRPFTEGSMESLLTKQPRYSDRQLANELWREVSLFFPALHFTVLVWHLLQQTEDTEGRPLGGFDRIIAGGVDDHDNVINGIKTNFCDEDVIPQSCLDFGGSFRLRNLPSGMEAIVMFYSTSYNEQSTTFQEAADYFPVALRDYTTGWPLDKPVNMNVIANSLEHLMHRWNAEPPRGTAVGIVQLPETKPDTASFDLGFASHGHVLFQHFWRVRAKESVHVGPAIFAVVLPGIWGQRVVQTPEP